MDADDAGRLLGAGVDLTEAELAELVEHAEAGPRGCTLPRCRSELAAQEEKARLPLSEATGWWPTTCGRSCSRTCRRTRSASSPAPPFSSGCQVPRDAVLESSGGAAMLERLERSNLFLVPLDSDRQWYRYHHLFQELLRAGSSTPTRTSCLPCSHAPANGVWRTGSWRRRWGVRAGGRRRRPSGKAVRAVRPARLSERPGRDHRALARLARAHGAMERNAAVAALGAAVASTWGRPAEAERLFEAAERASYEGSLPDGSTSVDSWLAIVRAQLCRRGVADARRCGVRSGRSRVGASTGRTPRSSSPSRSGWPARLTRPTTCSPKSPRKGSSWERWGGGAGARRARRDRDRARDVGPGRRVGGAGARDHPPRSDGGVPQQRVRLGGGGPRRASR